MQFFLVWGDESISFIGRVVIYLFLRNNLFPVTIFYYSNNDLSLYLFDFSRFMIKKRKVKKITLPSLNLSDWNKRR